MKNFDASAKSRGVVLFANNTETVDYESIAQRSQQLIEHYLQLPVTILSTESSKKNSRYNLDTGKFEGWNNQQRYMAYELSPYDQTILLDSDYLVLDDSLLKVLDTLQDYKIIRHNQYLDGSAVHSMGTYSIPYLWATVVAFDRSPKSQMLFDFVGRIERNYAYYRQLYNITATNFRNDYAFTIADLALNGYTQDSQNYIPWAMLSVGNTIDSLALQGNQIIIKSNGCAWVLPRQSLHIMSKAWLQSDQFEQFIKDAVSA